MFKAYSHFQCKGLQFAFFDANKHENKSFFQKLDIVKVIFQLRFSNCDSVVFFNKFK